MEIYIQRNGQIEGPLSQSQYRERFQMGSLHEDDLVSTDQKSWIPLSQLVNPAPVAGGRWRREYKCKRCGVPFKTLTLGRLKVTDNCGKCNARHDRVITACFAVFLIAAFVADKILDRKHEDQIKKANAYVSSLSNPTPHATPNDNAFLFTPSLPSPSVSSNGLRMEPPRRRTEQMVFPTISPLAESPTPTQNLSADEQHVGLRKSEAVFLAGYGKVYDSYLAELPEPADTKVDWFYHAGLFYMVLFRHDLAQDVLVVQKDGNPLTEEDIQTALNAYADGGEWMSAPLANPSVIKRWERDGAVANLGKHSDNGGSRGRNNPDQFLQIATAEYIQGSHR